MAIYIPELFYFAVVYRAVPYKTKQFLTLLVKLSIVFGAAYFVYNKLVTNGKLDVTVLIDTLRQNKVFTAKNVLLLLSLSLLNWLLEAFKWQTLVSSIKKIPFKSALEQSLGSLTASLFTPNRIGEYGAKAVYFSKYHRKKVLFLNLWSNLMQMSVTVLLGVLGLSFFLYQFEVTVNYFRILRMVLLITVLLGFGLVGLQHRRLQIKGFTYAKIKGFVQKMPIKIHIWGFFISLFRYLTFSFQFYWLLKALGLEIDYLNAMMFISSMYLLASIIPTIFIFDVVIRGGIAVWLFGFIEVNELTILCVTTTMWLLNFVLPSVFGSYYVLNFNFYSSSNASKKPEDIDTDASKK